jgi:hypothetical protein
MVWLILCKNRNHEMHQIRPEGWGLLVPPFDQVCFVSTSWVPVFMSSLYYFSSSISSYSWNSSEDGGNIEETEPSEMLRMHLVLNIEGFPRALLRTVTFNGVVCGVWTQRFKLRKFCFSWVHQGLFHANLLHWALTKCRYSSVVFNMVICFGTSDFSACQKVHTT